MQSPRSRNKQEVKFDADKEIQDEFSHFLGANVSLAVHVFIRCVHTFIHPR